MRAILWRELKIGLGSIFGIAFQFLTPIFMLVFFATIFAGNIGGLLFGGTQISYLDFFTPGLFGYTTFMILGASLVFLRMDTQSGMLAIIILSKVSLSGYFWGKYIVQVILVAIKIILLAIISVILSRHIPHISLQSAAFFIIALMSGAAIWFSLGMLGGILVKREDIREVVMMVISLPLTFASTMYYNLESAPAIIRAISVINPLTYICNVFRGCYLGLITDELILQVIILVALAILLLALSYQSLRRIRL